MMKIHEFDIYFLRHSVLFLGARKFAPLNRGAPLRMSNLWVTHFSINEGCDREAGFLISNLMFPCLPMLYFEILPFFI